MESVILKRRINCILLPLIILNLFDGIATFIGLNLGVYIELNKMLDLIYKANPLIFIFIKIILPTLIFILLSIKLRENISSITKLFVYIGNCVYSSLCIYHVILLFCIII